MKQVIQEHIGPKSKCIAPDCILFCCLASCADLFNAIFPPPKHKTVPEALNKSAIDSAGISASGAESAITSSRTEAVHEATGSTGSGSAAATPARAEKDPLSDIDLSKLPAAFQFAMHAFERYTQNPELRSRAQRLLEVLSSKSNEALEQFIIGFNEGKREEILKFVAQQKEPALPAEAPSADGTRPGDAATGSVAQANARGGAGGDITSSGTAVVMRPGESGAGSLSGGASELGPLSVRSRESADQPRT